MACSVVLLFAVSVGLVSTASGTNITSANRSVPVLLNQKSLSISGTGELEASPQDINDSSIVTGIEISSEPALNEQSPPIQDLPPLFNIKPVVDVQIVPENTPETNMTSRDMIDDEIEVNTVTGYGNRTQESTPVLELDPEAELNQSVIPAMVSGGSQVRNTAADDEHNAVANVVTPLADQKRPEQTTAGAVVPTSTTNKPATTNEQTEEYRTLQIETSTSTPAVSVLTTLQLTATSEFAPGQPMVHKVSTDDSQNEQSLIDPPADDAACPNLNIYKELTAAEQKGIVKLNLMGHGPSEWSDKLARKICTNITRLIANINYASPASNDINNEVESEAGANNWILQPYLVGPIMFSRDSLGVLLFLARRRIDTLERVPLSSQRTIEILNGVMSGLQDTFHPVFPVLSVPVMDNATSTGGSPGNRAGSGTGPFNDPLVAGGLVAVLVVVCIVALISLIILIWCQRHRRSHYGEFIINGSGTKKGGAITKGFHEYSFDNDAFTEPDPAYDPDYMEPGTGGGAGAFARPGVSPRFYPTTIPSSPPSAGCMNRSAGSDDKELPYVVVSSGRLVGGDAVSFTSASTGPMASPVNLPRVTLQYATAGSHKPYAENLIE